jgi:RNA polymerase sigma-70 factor (ECF subfamily)
LQIIALYDQLYALRPNTVVALNRSVAVAELHGPVEGLAALAEIDPASLENYQPYHAARADLLARAGRRDEALGAYAEPSNSPRTHSNAPFSCANEPPSE